MAAMLSRLGGQGYCVAENSVPYGTKPEKVDPDPGPDFDFEKEKPQQGGEAPGYRRLTADDRKHRLAQDNDTLTPDSFV